MSRFRTIALVVLALLGIAARVWLSWHSLGTFDEPIWRDFAQHAHDRGLLDLYRNNAGFNHPPLAGLFAGTVWTIAQQFHWSFAFAFRLPIIACDLVTCVLLVLIHRSLGDKRLSWLAAAVFAWNLNSILITSHHVNTDSALAMFMLLAAYLLESKRAPLLSALALGAAINIKLIPVFLVFPMLAACRSREEMKRFAIGLAIAAIPFVVTCCFVPRAFYEHVLKYASFESDWGVPWLLRATLGLPIFSTAAINPKIYFSIGKWVVLAAIVVLAIDVRRRKIDAYTAAASAAALFLIFTPGFTIPYTVIVTPLLLVVSVRHGWVYALLAGVTVLCVYVRDWNLAFPIDTRTSPPTLLAPATLYGLLAWGVLVSFVWKALHDARLSSRVPDHLS